ncbi:MAG: preprotein translocase subunit YajC [Bacteroidales bacterium]|nr:preprotein translocase subunit YajC [Bacteroidales bacterium]
MKLTQFILLQAEGQQPGGMGSSMIFIILILVVMWVLMLRPQRKKEKEERKFREGLQKGNRVLFSGGIYGKVHSVGTTTVEVEVANGVVMTVEKSMVQPAPESKDEEKK